MSRPLIAGNWKMNLDREGSAELAAGLSTRAGEVPEVDLVICPPSIYLQTAFEMIGSSPVKVGAQDVYHEANGAFTGEISTSMLLDIGCTFVILGHSERRHVMGETDADVNKKLKAALGAGLTPIVCVGELLKEREAGKTAQVIRKQIEGSLADVGADEIAKIVVAYEPVWAIGTGKVATPEQAEEVHSDLRKLLSERYNSDVAKQVRLLYGGSVKPGNAAELLSQPNVDGVLVGGASLKLDDFMAIAAAA